MAKKKKYEDLSAKEREEMEMAGIKGAENSGVNKGGDDTSISIIDAGKKEFKRRQKEQPKEISAKKAAKQEIKEFKKTGALPEFSKTEEVDPKLKAVTDAAGVETVTHQTFSNPLEQPLGAGIVPASNISDTSVNGNSPTVDGNEKVDVKSVTDIIDGNRGNNMHSYDEDINAVSNLDGAIDMEVESANDAQKLLGYISGDEEGDPSENFTQNIMTTEDIVNESDAALYDYAQGDQDIYRKAKEYRDQLKDSKINASAPAIEKLGLQQYYPDLGRPLQVGTYSGSVIGSNPIFVAGGGRIPVGIIDARKRALEKAGKEKATNKRKMMEMAYAKGAVPIQHQVDDMSVNLIDKYMDLTGGDFSLLNDPSNALGREWYSEVAELQTFAKRTKMTDGLVKQMMKDELDEKKHVPKFARKMQSMWNSGSLSMKDFKKDQRKFNQLEQGVQSYASATHILKKYKDLKLDKVPMRTDIDWNSKETANKVNQVITKLRSGNYDNLYSMTREFMDLGRIEKIVDTELDQNKIYLGLSPKEREGRRQEYIDYTMSLFADKLESKITTVTHNQAKFKEQMAFKKKKYADTKTTLLTNIVDGDRAIANEGSKLNLERTAALSNQGITTPSEVRGAYTGHMGFEAITDKKNPNRLAGRVPLSGDQKKSKFSVPASGLEYKIEGKLYSYGEARDLAIRTSQGYPNSRDFEIANPELAGMLNIPADGNINIKITDAEHSYGMDQDGERVELGIDNYGENSDNAFNMYTENYSSSYETSEDILSDDNQSKVSIYTVGGEDFATKAKAEKHVKSLNAEAVIAGTTSDASITTTNATRERTYKTPQVVYRYNIDNKNENALAGSSLTKSTRDLNLVDDSVPGAGVEDGSSVTTTSTESGSGGGFNSLFDK